jgi:hypothetical protein
MSRPSLGLGAHSTALTCQIEYVTLWGSFGREHIELHAGARFRILRPPTALTPPSDASVNYSTSTSSMKA